MLRRIRSRITPSGVIATIALFAALGGGYAVAFKGSGTLQKAAKDLSGTTTFQDVRSLKGFGMLRARCDKVEHEVEYQIKNTSNNNIGYRAVRAGDNQFAAGFANKGEPPETIAIGSGSNFGSMRIHLYKEGLIKNQVDIVAANSGPLVQSECGVFLSPVIVHVMALNTVE